MLNCVSKKTEAILLTILSALAIIFVPYFVGFLAAKCIDLKDFVLYYWCCGFLIIILITIFCSIIFEIYNKIYEKL
jgi:hypothetical protein